MDPDKNLWEDLHAFLLGNGASVVGCGSMLQVPDSKRDGYPTGISIGVALDPSLIEGLLESLSQAFRENAASVRTALVRLRHSCVDFLVERGHQARFSRSGITDEANYMSDLPHKTVATRAGLGWIGKSTVLISEDFGGALRFTSVLTDAPLPASWPCDASRCGSCEACVVHCPGKAIIGADWQVGVDRASMFRPTACDKARTERSRAAGLGDARLCDVCIAVCPWTTRFIQRKKSQQAHAADKPDAGDGR
jgi:epoxyqueuosine reductase QueG